MQERKKQLKQYIEFEKYLKIKKQFDKNLFQLEPSNITIMPIVMGNPLIPEITKTLENRRDNNNRSFEKQKYRSNTCSVNITPRDTGFSKD